LHFLTGPVYQRLLGLWGENGFKILIAGRTALPGFAQEALKQKPEFEFLGFVEDLDRLMSGCHAVLAPIDVPVGNRCRILTTMSKGQLIIAHKNTALGNPDLVHGETCLLAGNAEDFVNCMRIAVERPEEVDLIKKKAWQSCCLRFSPEAVLNRLATELKRLLGPVRGET
jgi:glycosyltransferase involved in cell wall biosynthesis